MEQQSKDSQSSFEKMKAHPHFPNFLLYSLSYILFGQVITALGPMFPYLAVHEGRLETQYSFLFSTRGFGFIFGSIIVKLFGSKGVTLHQLIGTGVILMSLFSVLFNQFQHLYMKGLCIFMSSIGGSFLDISINIAALQCFKGKNLSIWLQSIHGCFGIGGLLSPFAFDVLGFLGFFTIFFYYYLETPQKAKKQNQQAEQKPQIQIPQLSMILISLCFFCAVGQQVSYGGWVSSYAVLNDFSTKQHATFYSSLYWISITFFRFALALVLGQPSKKIAKLGLVGVITSFVSYFLIFYVHVQFGLVVMSILYGLCNSVLYPLLLTVPQQFGYKLTVKQGTTFVISASLGQGLLAVFVGKMMGWFSYNWIIYGICLMNIAIILAISFNANYMVKHRLEVQKYNEAGNIFKDENYLKKQKSLEMKLIEK